MAISISNDRAESATGTNSGRMSDIFVVCAVDDISHRNKAPDGDDISHRNSVPLNFESA